MLDTAVLYLNNIIYALSHMVHLLNQGYSNYILVCDLKFLQRGVCVWM